MSATAALAHAIPTAREWRLRLRRTRSAHHGRTLGDVLTDLYTLLWVVLVYGGALVSEVRRHLGAGVQLTTVSAEHYWIGVAVLLAGAGLAWQGLRTLGPLLATPAEQAWGVSTPVDRQGWLLPRFAWSLLAAGLVGAGAAVVVAAVGARSSALGWAALAGCAWGVTATALSVVAQGAPFDRRWLRLPGVVLMGAGAVTAALLVAAHYAGSLPTRPAAPVVVILALLGLPLAAVAVAVAARTLPRLGASRLGAGAQLAEAAFTSAVSMDPSLLSGVLEVRRWRRVGRVRSRPFGAGMAGVPMRPWVLVQADLRRLLRRPGALWTWGGLALAQFVVAVVAPSAAGTVHVLAGFVVAVRLMAGLTALSRSPGLRRALGGGEFGLRLAHVVVPAYGTALWWALTWPAGGAQGVPLELLLTVGVVAAAYRASTRPPMTYGDFVVETPFGLVPVELILQLARGPDLLAGVLVARVLFAG